MLRDIEQLLAQDRAVRAAVVAAAVWLSTAFNLGLALYDQHLAYLVYWAEIAGFSIVVGAEAGGLALFGTTVCVLFFFVPPSFSVRIDTRHDAALIGGYLLIGAAIWGSAAVWHHIRRP